MHRRKKTTENKRKQKSRNAFIQAFREAMESN
nr:MAG TPA: hypothetical protein [Caudoviricetes sp.]DAZ30458.1 MAG TPA: hypothetical protein [Caudoviricetes sp.]